MADYNIYIHDVSSNSNGLSSKTTPFSNQSEEENPASAFSSKVTGAFNKSQQFASSGFSGEIQQGIAILAKAVPWVAIVVAAIKITDKILTTSADLTASANGDYRFQMAYNNVKTIIGNVINPISMGKRMIERDIAFTNHNIETQQKNLLTGNIIINNLSDRGV